MKAKLTKWMLLSIGMCLTLSAASQDKGWGYLAKRYFSQKTFGAPMVEIWNFNGDVALNFGGGGALMVDDKYILGGYGIGMISDHRIESASEGSFETSFGHAGLLVGYIWKPEKVVHFSTITSIGYGSIDMDNEVTGVGYSDNGPVIHPKIEMQVNAIYWMRIGLGVGYQWAGGMDLPGYQASDFNSPTGNLTFYFGRFGPRPESGKEKPD